ncbi:MAG: GtrA family protein, partial [Devosia sp.]
VCINVLVLALDLDPTTASVTSYLVSVVFSYLMQSRFTFRRKQDTAMQMVKFLVTSLFGFLVSYFSVAYATYLGLHYVVGAIIVCAVLPIANYFIFKRWVFARLED